MGNSEIDATNLLKAVTAKDAKSFSSALVQVFEALEEKNSDSVRASANKACAEFLSKTLKEVEKQAAASQNSAKEEKNSILEKSLFQSAQFLNPRGRFTLGLSVSVDKAFSLRLTNPKEKDEKTEKEKVLCSFNVSEVKHVFKIPKQDPVKQEVSAWVYVFVLNTAVSIQKGKSSSSMKCVSFQLPTVHTDEVDLAINTGRNKVKGLETVILRGSPIKVLEELICKIVKKTIVLVSPGAKRKLKKLAKTKRGKKGKKEKGRAKGEVGSDDERKGKGEDKNIKAEIDDDEEEEEYINSQDSEESDSEMEEEEEEEEEESEDEDEEEEEEGDIDGGKVESTNGEIVDGIDYEVSNFKSSTGFPYVKCYHRTSDGLLYPLPQGLLFFRPFVFISREEIAQLQANRGGSGNSRTFDVAVEVEGEEKQIEFRMVEREEISAISGYADAMGKKKEREGENGFVEDNTETSSDDDGDLDYEDVEKDGQSVSVNDSNAHSSADEAHEDDDAAAPKQSHKPKLRKTSKSDGQNVKERETKVVGRKRKTKEAQSSPTQKKNKQGEKGKKGRGATSKNKTTDENDQAAGNCEDTVFHKKDNEKAFKANDGAESKAKTAAKSTGSKKQASVSQFFVRKTK